LGDTPNNLTERDYEDLARKADGFSGSDVAVCVSFSLPLIIFLLYLVARNGILKGNIREFRHFVWYSSVT
jgi:hypothetical protein